VRQASGSRTVNLTKRSFKAQAKRLQKTTRGLNIMQEVPSLEFEINASSDGHQIIFSRRGKDAATFVFDANKLPAVAERLLRILAQPNVSSLLPSTPPTAPGKIEEVRPYQIVAMSVSKVFLVEAVGLFLDLVGGLRLYFQFSADDGAKLSQQLQDAVQQVRQQSLGRRQ
jgi:hypothetical protein